MLEYLEVSTALKNLLRRADRFGYDLEQLKEEIEFISDNYKKVAERLEVKMLEEV